MTTSVSNLENKDELDQRPPQEDDAAEAATASETNGHTQAAEPEKEAPPKRTRSRSETKRLGQSLRAEDTAPLNLAESIKGRMHDAKEDAKRARSDLVQRRSDIMSAAALEAGKIDIAIGELDAIIGDEETAKSWGRSPALKKATARSAKRSASGRKSAPRPKRLRRSAEDIAAGIKAIVAAVKRAGKEGMRAEEIKAHLNLEAREMPKLLNTALESKQLIAKGRNRGTRYFAK